MTLELEGSEVKAQELKEEGPCFTLGQRQGRSWCEGKVPDP